jgi:hypothetical protein
MYHAASDGLSGNEDCGQMSAWYVMSAMGLYAVTPGRPEYHLAAPLFPKIHLSTGEGIFEIEALGVDEGKPFIQSATLNGEPLHALVISHAAIMAGAKLVYVMGTEPNEEWAGSHPQLPVSKIDARPIAAVPFFKTRAQTFSDTLTVRIATVQPGTRIYYTRDGSTPTTAAYLYARPLVLDSNTVLKAISVAPTGQQSPVARAEFFKIDPSRKLTLGTPYENQYAAGGNLALIDGLHGSPNFRTGRWQGYQHDLEGVVDLGKEMRITKVAVGFLQDINSWIWMPKDIGFETSLDGIRYQSMGNYLPKTPDHLEGATLETATMAIQKPLTARYIRIKARNYGKCPPWHLGAGGDAWIFADEILVEGI